MALARILGDLDDRRSKGGHAAATALTWLFGSDDRLAGRPASAAPRLCPVRLDLSRRVVTPRRLVALPMLIANLALELAPIRVNLIAAGFVDTPLSASLLGDDLDRRRGELRAMLLIRRVVGPSDIAALAVHIMSNTALTGATYDIDGGQQLVARWHPGCDRRQVRSDDRPSPPGSGRSMSACRATVE